jgi:hypothetical protein
MTGEGKLSCANEGEIDLKQWCIAKRRREERFKPS